ncbi:MAG: glycoside hydrolase family 43 protein [Lacrimispora sp.]
MKNKIQNPILRGFHPDPSIIRVEDDYYLATSTFEWWPGVRLHHSKDLIHWELMPYPLNRTSQLDLRGVGASQGIWAPDLSYDNGIFYLVFTVVNSFYCNMYDTNNYLVTAQSIYGPWSDPVPLSNFGFDPSLFHDDDGKKYMVGMVTDHRVPKKYAGRLILQEYDGKTHRMKGSARDIYQGDRIFLEGPHIFKRNGWYYLFSADTGTGEGHGQTIQRARDIWGPYEMFQADFMERTSENEAFSILSSRHHEEILLQKAGHCDLVETAGGEWYAVHLCGRPSRYRNPADGGRFPGERRYMLGRETAIQKMTWTDDGWLVMESGGSTPQTEVDGPEAGKENGSYVYKTIPDRDEFCEDQLSFDYQSLRIPMDETYISLKARPGYLRMYGRSGLSSKFSQTLIARRMTEYNMEISTAVEFEPENFKQMAGLIILYDTDNYLYLHISKDEDARKCVTLLKAENKKYEYLADYIPVESNKMITLSAEIKEGEIQFFWKAESGEERKIGREINGSFLSDEACEEGWFTGTMCGICCQDLTGAGLYADFDYFEVKANT